jgi:hypothetical protein
MPCAVMWNDLELYQDYRDFTVDPVTFPPNEMRDFIGNLVSQPVLLLRLPRVRLTVCIEGKRTALYAIPYVLLT